MNPKISIFFIFLLAINSCRNHETATTKNKSGYEISFTLPLDTEIIQFIRTEHESDTNNEIRIIGKEEVYPDTQYVVHYKVITGGDFDYFYKLMFKRLDTGVWYTYKQDFQYDRDWQYFYKN